MTPTANQRGEDGFTLIELMIAMAVGLVVSLGAFGLVDSSLHLYSQITDRLDSAQTGQIAMANIEQTLESSCVSYNNAPVQAIATTDGINTGSDSTHLVVWSAPGDADTVTSQLFLHVFALSATTNGTLTDSTYAYTGLDASNNYVFSTTATSVRTLATHVSAVSGTPVFSYYTNAASGALNTTALTDNPLTVADTNNVSGVQITFSVAPSSGSAQTTRQTVEQDLVVFRLASSSSTGLPCT